MDQKQDDGVRKRQFKKTAAYAVAGGIVGIYHNKGWHDLARDINKKDCMRGIPEEWLQSLAKKEELNEMFHRFYKACDMPAFSHRQQVHDGVKVF